MGEQPQHVGKYNTQGEIGRGAFAIVYRAVDTTLDRGVALKVLHPSLLTDQTWLERFRREARALAALAHPHIVTIYEIGEADGRLFIAMELARGHDLGQVITERGCVPWEEALALLRPICEALDYAHSRGVIHRDLKPSNILLDQDRGPLLTDFGFARLVSDSSASLSLSGGILGTPPYIAPEVWEMGTAEGPADIYALSCIIHEMLTGQVLFAGQTPMQVMRAHDRGPSFPLAWPAGVPQSIVVVMGRALARDPAARYPTAVALYQAVSETQWGTHGTPQIPVQTVQTFYGKQGTPVVDTVQALSQPGGSASIRQVQAADSSRRPIAAPQQRAVLPRTSGLAIASLVASLAGASVVGLVLGYMAKQQIEASYGSTKGMGAANAAIILGWIGIGLVVLGLLLMGLVVLGPLLMSLVGSG